MRVLRYCRSCSGPRPRSAVRCPWCHTRYDTEPAEKPEHLFDAPQRMGPRDERREAR